MAGNDDPEAVVRAESSRRSLSPRMAGEPGEVSIGHHLTVRHTPQRADDVELESRPPVQLELDIVEGTGLPGEVLLEPLDQLLRLCRTPATDACVSAR